MERSLGTRDQELPGVKGFQTHIRQKWGWEMVLAAEVLNRQQGQLFEEMGFKRDLREEGESNLGVCPSVSEPLDMFPSKFMLKH